MLFVGILVVFAAIVVMKLVPAYIEFYSIQKVLSAMDKDPALKDAKNAEVRDSYARRAGIDNITAVKPEDLDISRDSGKLVVAAKYRPLMETNRCWAIRVCTRLQRVDCTRRPK